ncbi:YodC family protein [Aureimonas sp. AU40]|uniref:YodC family protein n=1 Tax=Aureimonas sp. AU40 TaxID=1637747 RepID=UPI000784950A|nr:DUF2158 domain-containing protein [Aureimonas sp. AU40]
MTEPLVAQHGDLVRLKSGGPAMTVEFVSHDQLGTVWFDGATLCRGDFKVSSLEAMPEPVVIHWYPDPHHARTLAAFDRLKRKGPLVADFHR